MGSLVDGNRKVARMSKNQTLEQIQTAIRGHGSWKLKLKTAITTGSSQLNIDEVSRDDCCDFGKWLYSNDISTDTKNGKPYQVIKRLHGEFHQCAGSVLREVAAGKQDTAKNVLNGPFAEKSSTLIMALGKWKGEIQSSK